MYPLENCRLTNAQADALWQFLNDLWLYHHSTLSWIQILPAGEPPPARAGHSAIWDVVSQSLFIYGGQSCTTFYDDIWIFRFQERSWSLLTQSGPGGRTGHSAIWDSRLAVMRVFGGVGDEGQNNELWRFRLESNSWVQSFPDGAIPEARSEHTAVWDAFSESMLMFGGWSWESHSPLQDLWSYDTWQGIWTPLAMAPQSRAGHVAVWDNVSMSMLVHGGTHLESTGYEKETWNYSLLLDKWTHLSLSLPNYGPDAKDHSAAWDSSSRSMFILGGLKSTGEDSNEFWRYLGSQTTVLLGECILGQQCVVRASLPTFDEGQFYQTCAAFVSQFVMFPSI